MFKHILPLSLSLSVDTAISLSFSIISILLIKSHCSILLYLSHTHSLTHELYRSLMRWSWTLSSKRHKRHTHSISLSLKYFYLGIKCRVSVVSTNRVWKCAHQTVVTSEFKFNKYQRVKYKSYLLPTGMIDCCHHSSFCKTFIGWTLSINHLTYRHDTSNNNIVWFSIHLLLVLWRYYDCNLQPLTQTTEVTST